MNEKERVWAKQGKEAVLSLPGYREAQQEKVPVHRDIVDGAVRELELECDKRTRSFHK